MYTVFSGASERTGHIAFSLFSAQSAQSTINHQGCTRSGPHTPHIPSA